MEALGQSSLSKHTQCQSLAVQDTQSAQAPCKLKAEKYSLGKGVVGETGLYLVIC